jgi:hypothetical protein
VGEEAELTAGVGAVQPPRFDRTPDTTCCRLSWRSSMRRTSAPTRYCAGLAELCRLLRGPAVAPATLHAVPAVFAHLLERRDALELLRNHLLRRLTEPVASTAAQQAAALRGKGDVGKTVLEAVFARATAARAAPSTWRVLASPR